MAVATSPSGTTSRVIHPSITLTLNSGKTLDGRLEYFIQAKSLVLFEDESLAPALLTVPADEAPDAHAALAPDEVLLRNWSDMRGAPTDLDDLGFVELTGQEVYVGTFRLQAFVARIL